MARSKCLDNLRRKRNLRVSENRRFILANGGSKEFKNRLEESRAIGGGEYTPQIFSESRTNRPSSITKARSSYSVAKAPKEKFQLPTGVKRLPRKLKKALKSA